MYHFISGYTAKVAGTEVGVKDPEPTFSRVLRRAVPGLAPDQVRRAARREAQQARRADLARQHRLVGRRATASARASSSSTRARSSTRSTRARSHNVADRRGSDLRLRGPDRVPGGAGRDARCRATRGPTRPRTTRRRRRSRSCSARTSRSTRRRRRPKSAPAARRLAAAECDYVAVHVRVLVLISRNPRGASSMPRPMLDYEELDVYRVPSNALATSVRMAAADAERQCRARGCDRATRGNLGTAGASRRGSGRPRYRGSSEKVRSPESGDRVRGHASMSSRCLEVVLRDEQLATGPEG